MEFHAEFNGQDLVERVVHQYNTTWKLGTTKILPMPFDYRVGVFIRQWHVGNCTIEF